MLKMTKIELEKISDPDKYMFFEQGMRGGVSYINKRYRGRVKHLKTKTGTVKKLIPNLMNKNNYVIHYRNLQQCLELGMKLKKIHRILKFKQKDWMKPYIDFNTQKRKEATNDADKNLFKLLNNAVYSKTMKS